MIACEECEKTEKMARYFMRGVPRLLKVCLVLVLGCLFGLVADVLTFPVSIKDLSQLYIYGYFGIIPVIVALQLYVVNFVIGRGVYHFYDLKKVFHSHLTNVWKDGFDNGRANMWVKMGGWFRESFIANKDGDWSKTWMVIDPQDGMRPVIGTSNFLAISASAEELLQAVESFGRPRQLFDVVSGWQLTEEVLKQLRTERDALGRFLVERLAVLEADWKNIGQSKHAQKMRKAIEEMLAKFPELHDRWTVEYVNHKTANEPAPASASVPLDQLDPNERLVMPYDKLFPPRDGQKQ